MAMRALLVQELRILCHNRAACFILVMIPITAWAVRLRCDREPIATEETCYIVFWNEDDWVRHLQAALRRQDRPEWLRIQLVPVERLAAADGIIRYPPNSHSIQLRPLEPLKDGRNRWLVWYWHSGRDASQLWPYAQWFWQTTREHFGQTDRWEERVSSLQPGLAIPGGPDERLTFAEFPESRHIQVVLLWGTLYFVACYLPVLSLAEARFGRTIDSLVLTPIGGHGYALSTGLFYGLLATTLCVAVTVILQAETLASPQFWLTILAASLLYPSVALAIGSRCRSVASASAGTVVYLLLSGGVFGIITMLPVSIGTVLAPWSCPEAALLGSFHATFESANKPDAWRLLPLLLWAMLWSIAGRSCYRKLWR